MRGFLFALFQFILGIVLFFVGGIIFVFFTEKIDNRRKKMAIVKAAICALCADGKADEKEMDLLREICQKMGIRQRTLKGLIREIEHGDSTLFIPSTIEERKEVLSYMAKMMWVDGDVDREENKLFIRLGNMYKIDPKDRKAILEEAGKASE